MKFVLLLTALLFLPACNSESGDFQPVPDEPDAGPNPSLPPEPEPPFCMAGNLCDIAPCVCASQHFGKCDWVCPDPCVQIQCLERDERGNCTDMVCDKLHNGPPDTFPQ